KCGDAPGTLRERCGSPRVRGRTSSRSSAACGKEGEKPRATSARKKRRAARAHGRGANTSPELAPGCGKECRKPAWRTQRLQPAGQTETWRRRWGKTSTRKRCT